jgi:hypothetical protein
LARVRDHEGSARYAKATRSNGAEATDADAEKDPARASSTFGVSRRVAVTATTKANRSDTILIAPEPNDRDAHGDLAAST